MAFGGYNMGIMRLIVCVVILLAGVELFGKTYPYFPTEHDHLSEISWGLDIGREIANTFRNPAALMEAERVQGQLEFSYGSFDTQRVQLSGLVPMYPFVISIGHDYFVDSDIKETQHDGFLPYISGQFSDAYHVTNMGISFFLDLDLSVGTVLSHKYRNIKDQAAHAYGIDFGVVWRGLQWIELGVYTQNLINTPLSWGTGKKEELLKKLTIEWVFQLSNTQWVVSTESTLDEIVHYYNIGGEWFIHNNLSLFGTISIDNHSIESVYQRNIGTILKLTDTLHFKYINKRKLAKQEEMNQQLIGISVLVL